MKKLLALFLIVALAQLAFPQTTYAATYDFEALVVAGGGGGGGTNVGGGAGGGGGGGYQEDVALTLTENTSYTITIGAGGSGDTGADPGADGNNSSIGTALVSDGGGGGGGSDDNGGAGGSGGGAGADSNNTGGAGTVGQGNDGGDHVGGGGADGGAGGGGAGGGGANNNSANDDGGSGGAGAASTISGSSVTRAGGGGGGGGFTGGTPGSGGAGGGGAGGAESNAGSNGTANTGGGGGGGGVNNGNGGAGGSGVVIIRFVTAHITVVTSTGGTCNTDGLDTYCVWNSSGAFEYTVTDGTYPQTTSPTVTQFASSVTSMPVSLPGSISSGDLLLAWVEVRNYGTWTVPSGWTQLGQQLGGSSVGQLTVFYRIADGTEGASATWTASAGTTAVWQVRKITTWHGTTPPEISTGASGDASAANPSSLTPSWGADETLWFAVAGHTAASTAAWSAGPSSYLDFTSSGASSGGAATSLGSAYYENNAASEDPGAFTVSGSNRWWAAFTIAVRPIEGDGGGSDTCTYTSGNWNVNYSDNCHITSDVNVDGDCNFIYDGAGSFSLSATIACQAVNGGAGFQIDGASGSAVIEIAN
ncbi:MAG: glycine-rich domain-containing protein [Bauldia litoralis]|uniref:glycine-rich domain-containing protein n=1 Tax=Bauldia litoralis TaxID=665467 RepID=UPI0032997608